MARMEVGDPRSQWRTRVRQIFLSLTYKCNSHIAMAEINTLLKGGGKLQVNRVFDKEEYLATFSDTGMPTCERCMIPTGNWCDVCNIGLCSECERKFRVCSVCQANPQPLCDGPSCNKHAQSKCGRCHSRGYCSRQCQKNDWRCKYHWHGNHRAVCGKE